MHHQLDHFSKKENPHFIFLNIKTADSCFFSMKLSLTGLTASLATGDKICGKIDDTD